MSNRFYQMSFIRLMRMKTWIQFIGYRTMTYKYCTLHISRGSKKGVDNHIHDECKALVLTMEGSVRGPWWADRKATWECGWCRPQLGGRGTIWTCRGVLVLPTWDGRIEIPKHTLKQKISERNFHEVLCL